MSQITVDVPATSANLGPGFDCLGLALDLRNTVEAEALDRPEWRVEVTGEGEELLPADDTNLVVRCVRFVFDRADATPAGARVRMINRIPLCSGLGSSAAARVAGLVAGNELCGRPFGTRELGSFAAEMEGHPDNVIPALVGGIVVAALEAGEPRWVRFDPPPGLTAVVAQPNEPLPTDEARRVLPDHYSLADQVYTLSRASLLVAALLTGSWEHLGIAMQDRIHTPYRAELIPATYELMAAATAAGALGAAISGAGPSILALCDQRSDEVAAAMTAVYERQGIEGTVRPIGLVSEGARVR